MERKAAIAQIGNTRKICLTVFAFIIVCFGVPAAFALDTMGLPAAGLRQEKFSVGIDYSHSKMDLELNEGIYHDYVYGTYNTSGDLEALILKDFKIDRGYINLGYGISDMTEAFLRVGGSSAKFGESLFEGEKFDGNTDFSIGAGVKATFYEDEKLKIGGLFQVNWSQFDGALKADDWPNPDYPGADNIKVEITEVQIAVGPTYELEEDVLIYGGPFYHYVNGELDDTYSAPVIEDEEGNMVEYFITTEYHWAMEEDASYGGYIGTRLELAEDCSFNMEYQLTGAAYCIGASITWRF